MPVDYFLVPYDHSGCDRLIPFDAATEEIRKAGGYWSEAEVDGDRAIIRCRAPRNLLRDLATTFDTVPDPSAFWTETRSMPFAASGEVGFGDSRVRSRTLADLEADVLDAKGLSAAKRRVAGLIRVADRQGYARLGNESWEDAARLLAFAADKGYGLDRISTGTFPTSSVLDDFNRADSTTSLGSNWTANLRPSGWPSLGISSNAAYANTAFKSAYWNVSQPGPDAEAFVTVATAPVAGSNNFLELWVRTQNPNSANLRGYLLRTDDAHWYAFRCDDTVFTQLGANLSGAISSGMKIGIEPSASTITLYSNNGSWASAGSRSDSTYLVAGYIGLTVGNDTGVRLDDFGGGTMPGTSTGHIDIAIGL